MEEEEIEDEIVARGLEGQGSVLNAHVPVGSLVRRSFLRVCSLFEYGLDSGRLFAGALPVGAGADLA